MNRAENIPGLLPIMDSTKKVLLHLCSPTKNQILFRFEVSRTKTVKVRRPHEKGRPAEARGFSSKLTKNDFLSFVSFAVNIFPSS